MRTDYLKRTQKDYTLNFKLQLVQSIEQGELSLSEARKKYGIQGESTVRKWLEKYGNFDWENKQRRPMSKTPEQQLLELEVKVRVLEKQNKQLQEEKHFAEQKAVIFDMMINIAERECKIDIRKNLETAQSKSIQAKKKKP